MESENIYETHAGILAIAPEGFVLAFKPKTRTGLERRLAAFDATEWRRDVDSVFKSELANLDLALLANPSPIFEALGETKTREFLERLDPEILALSGCNFSLHNFLHSPEPFRKKARLQALRVMPALLGEFAKGDDETDRIRRRIDAGKGLWDSILEIHPGSTAALKRIAASGEAVSAWRSDLPKLLYALEQIPVDKIASTEAEWGAMRGAWVGLGIDAERDDWRRRSKLAWFKSFAMAGWVKSFESVQSVEGGFFALQDCFDFIEETARAVEHSKTNPDAERWTWARSVEIWNQIREAVAVSLSPRKMLDASRQWHAALYQRAGLDAEATLSGDFARWLPLLPGELDLGGGVRARFLCSRDELAEEGRTMSHCVAGYWSKCFSARSHIAALFGPGPRDRSTVELATGYGTDRNCHVVQHRSFRNSAPPPAHTQAESALIRQVLIGADFKRIAQAGSKAQKALDVLEPSWSDMNPERVEAARAAFGPARFDAIVAKF